MAQKLFVTVGTSIFTNLIDWLETVRHPKKSFIAKTWNNVKNSRYKSDEKQILIDFIQNDFLTTGNKEVEKVRLSTPGGGFKNELLWKRSPEGGSGVYTNAYASAEIQSILKIHQEETWEKVSFILYLITTDTAISKLAAEIIELYFKDQPYISEIKIGSIPNLQVANQNSLLEKGFQNLISFVAEEYTYTNSKRGRIPALLNITGGYKGFIPILYLVSQLLKIPIVYLYEESKELIVFHPLPLSFNWTYMELYRYFLTNKTFNINEITTSTKILSFFQENMLKNRFMSPLSDDKGVFERTAFGDLLKMHIEEVYTLSSSNFGIPFELLFYEYFIKQPFTWHQIIYDRVTHNKKLPLNETIKVDFDFELSTQNLNDGVVVVEVTSAYQLMGNSYKFKKQFEKRQVPLIKKENLNVNVYLLILYQYNSDGKTPNIKNNINKIWQKLGELGVEQLNVYTVDLPLHQVAASNNKNIYSAIFQKKITDDKNTYEKGKLEKYGNPFLFLKLEESLSRKTN